MSSESYTSRTINIQHILKRILKCPNILGQAQYFKKFIYRKINTFTAIVDLIFQTRALRSFSLNQLRDLSFIGGELIQQLADIISS